MSDTPRTDDFEDGCINPVEWADFARQLERELADMTKQRDALAEALASLLSGVKDGWFNEGKWWHTGIEQAEQALASTKGESHATLQR